MPTDALISLPAPRLSDRQQKLYVPYNLRISCANIYLFAQTLLVMKQDLRVPRPIRRQAKTFACHFLLKGLPENSEPPPNGLGLEYKGIHNDGPD